ncbi:alpha/beta hydrolase domain-containing protein [Massilia sp. LXY-6]|uniref:alpha/beta hydrolase domain-containing protein n=1 Tax=Massilia sp. LXY-6 TaxID=3379823 RepID=UPI003EDFA09D
MKQFSRAAAGIDLLRRGFGLSLAACLAVHGSVNASPSIPTAAVTRVASAGLPLNSDAQQLATKNYVEEEFYVAGKANRYRIPDVMANAQLIDKAHPYVSRVLVRRPADPARFNGTVVVEWLNVSLGHDADFVYASVRELLVREGYAWVGVSAQHVGVEGLIASNPSRYGKLTLAASNSDPVGGKEIDPPGRGAGGDVLGWDVFSQVGATVAGGASPIMGGFKVERLIAAGESQSSFRLGMYYNSIQPLYGIYDGFLLYDRGPEFALRTDLGTKLVSFGSEFMNFFLKGSPQPDSTNQRWWEVAGASHESVDEIANYMDPQILRDHALKGPDGASISLTDFEAADCAITPVWSRVPNGDVMKAALKGLNTWLVSGVAPPTVPRLVSDDQKQLVRDTQGRVSGGIHTAAYDAPRAKNGAYGSGKCTLAGYHIDFTPQQMCQRYGSHAEYVNQVQRIVNVNLRDRVLLPEEAERTVNEARQLTFDCGALEAR